MEFNSLKEVRNEIDSIDKELLPLFLKRMECSEEVVRLKMLDNTPIFNPVREQEILDDVALKSGNMSKHAVSFYSALMAISKVRQQEILSSNKKVTNFFNEKTETIPNENAKVCCQGVEGAYSNKAALKLFNKPNIKFVTVFDEVFSEIESGKTDFGVLPVENSLAGSVHEVYSLIMKHRFFIVNAISLKVSHCIACKKGTNLKKLISHPQAIMQCSEYINENNLEKLAVSNTAAAAKFVSESQDYTIGAICSVEAANEYGLDIIAQDVQDDKNNHTRFVVISKEPIVSENADKISLCFALKNETGSLFRMLERFATSGLNLCKIESRPIKGSSFEYDFYLDFTGNVKDKAVAVFLNELQNELPRFSYLGNYKEIQG